MIEANMLFRINSVQQRLNRQPVFFNDHVSRMLFYFRIFKTKQFVFRGLVLVGNKYRHQGFRLAQAPAAPIGTAWARYNIETLREL